MAEGEAQAGKTTPVLPDAAGAYPGDDAAPGTPGTGEDICPACNGKERLQGGAECRTCGGTGKVIKGIAGG
jgi:hypothetical protein